MAVAEVTIGETEVSSYEQPNEARAGQGSARARAGNNAGSAPRDFARHGHSAIGRRQMEGTHELAHESTQALRVVVFQEHGQWIAQCIEHDIGAQGKTYRDMAEHFALAVSLERDESTSRHGKPFAGIDPAPAYFHRMWEKRSSTLLPIQSAEQSGPGYEMALVA